MLDDQHFSQSNDEDMSVDDRVKMSQYTRNRMHAKGLEFDLPPGKLPVIMMDDIVHTADFPVCADSSCICHREEYKRCLEESRQEKQQKKRRKGKILLQKNYESARGTLNGNKSFQILR